VVDRKLSGGSSGPEVQLFKRFKEQWDFIDKESFDAALTVMCKAQ
jgi:hypothetical protein